MDITTNNTLAANATQAETSQAINMTVLKKALDISASNAKTLVESLPAPLSANLPGHLGQNVNTQA
ncbi:MAG: YjfB family protein [Janthinobacterium lividum]